MEMLPACFIPCESMESPAAAKTVTPASTRYLRKFTGSLGSYIRKSENHSPRSHREKRITNERKELKDFLCDSVVKKPLASGLGEFGGGLVAVLFHQLVALRAQLQEGLRFFVKALAIGAVKRGLPQDAEDGLGPEIIFVVEA